jgi:hypothetical protein
MNKTQGFILPNFCHRALSRFHAISISSTASVGRDPLTSSNQSRTKSVLLVCPKVASPVGVKRIADKLQILECQT